MKNITSTFFRLDKPFLFSPGVSGFISAGSVCDSLPAEGDLHPAAIPSGVPGLCHGSCAWSGLHREEDPEEATGLACTEDGEAPQPTHPEEHVSLPDWPLLWNAYYRWLSATLKLRCKRWIWSELQYETYRTNTWTQEDTWSIQNFHSW